MPQALVPASAGDPKVTTSEPRRIVTGTGNWSRAAFLATKRSIKGGLRVKFRVADVSLGDHGEDENLDRDHGFKGGGASFFYELGLIDNDETPTGAGALRNALWLTLHLRAKGHGEHEAVLRSAVHPRRGMHPDRGGVRHLDTRTFKLGVKDTEIVFVADEAGYSVSWGSETAIAGDWKGIEAVRDALVENARPWAHLGNWNNGRGKGSIAVLVGSQGGE